MSYRILHDRSNLNQRSGWNDQHGGLFRILMPRTAGTPNLPFKIGRTKTPRVAPILATPAAKPLAVARSCVGNKLGASVNVVELGPAFINKLNRMNPANTRGMCPGAAGELDTRAAIVNSNMPKA